MRFVGTALIAGTIWLFSLLTQGEWIRAGTEKLIEPKSVTPPKSQAASVRFQHFHDIEGLTVENVDGQEIGRITDLVVERNTMQPKYVIIKSGSFLGGHRLILVPTSAIAITTAKVGVAAIDITKQKWKHAPEYSKKDLTSLGQPDKARQVARFYDRSERVARSGLTAEQRSRDVSPTGHDTTPVASRRNVSCFLASELIGRSVVGREGSEIGEVSDLMMDFAGDKPTLAIISVVGISNAEDQFAVPLRMLNPRSDQKVLVDANRSAFQHARQFRPSNLANAEKSEKHEIFRYER
jgi:sporulation protein YlmC with PRC-barrel domain